MTDRREGRELERMPEPVGWNIYHGGSLERPVFSHFEPNEPVLSRVAADFADDVERSLAEGGQASD